MTKIALMGKAFRTGFAGSGLLVLTLLLTACSYRGDLATPFAQKLTWFSLVNGDDIRKACGPGAPERIRLVYNGRYQEQLRVYDLVESDPAGGNPGGAELTARAQDSESYGKLGSIQLSSPLDAWQWHSAAASLQPDAYRRLKRALGNAGLGAPAPVGTELLSSRFYWVAVACLEGDIQFQAWQAPQADVTRLPFVAQLLEFDGTGVAFNAPRPLSAAEVAFNGPGPQREQESFGFRLKVGERGLAGLMTPF